MTSSSVTLRPCVAEHILLLIESQERFLAASGLELADGLRGFYVSAEVSSEWLAALQNSTGADPWRHGFFAIHDDSGVVIGSAGFKGAPDDDGIVEIAYGIVPAFEGRGYATEVSRALIAFAFGQQEVNVIRAHTRPDNRASARVLEKNGFALRGEVMDPEDGLLLEWELGR